MNLKVKSLMDFLLLVIPALVGVISVLAGVIAHLYKEVRRKEDLIILLAETRGETLSKIIEILFTQKITQKNKKIRKALKTKNK